MQARDTFQLTYSPSLKASKIRISLPPDEDAQVHSLSPNKQNLFMTFKQSIMQPHAPQPDILSSLTSVESSLPCSQTQEVKKQKQIQTSLPFTKDIAKSSIKAQQKLSKNKSREESLRARVSRESLLKKIEDATSFLVYGIEADKYCYSIKRIERSVLFFSEDVHFMGIHRVINGKAKILKMRDCQGIIQGIKTQRFKDYLQSGYQIKQQNSLSILFPDRSYDFSVRCNAIRDRLVQELKFLWQQIVNEK